MKAQLMKFSRVNFTGKIEKSSWNRIPAVSNVTVKVGELNDLLKRIGIDKRLPANIKFDDRDTKAMNRYMGHQIIRLRKAQGSPSTFWTIANFCLLRSASFRASAINHVLPEWWYGIPYWKVLKFNREVSEILGTKDKYMEFKRVYIPKANQKWRPLGVPTPSWRIAMHMLNNMIQLYFEKDVLAHQHGFIPGRGTLSAWRDIISRALNARYIYETDLKGFFDNVSNHEITRILFSRGIPHEWSMWIRKIMNSVPKLPKIRKLDESRFSPDLKFHKVDDWLISEGKTKSMARMYDPVNIRKEAFKYLNWWFRESVRTPEFRLKFQNWNSTPGGVPQGSPISPFLSILVMRKYLSQQAHVNYADDQIFFANKDFEIKDLPALGIVHNPEKCAWIKRDGKWLKELKFLGLIYNGVEGTLRSETRSGRSIRIQDSLIELYESIKYDDTTNYLENMAKRNFFGFVQACLYNGSFKSHETASILKEHSIHSWYGGYANSKTITSTAVSFLAADLKLGTYYRNKNFKEVTPRRTVGNNRQNF
jgi:hypothetical protein